MLTLPLNQLRSQNQNTILGSLWHLLNPLFLALVFYLVFGIILGGQRGIDNYPAFLITGIFIYHFTQKSVIAGTGTIVSNIRLIQTLSFPRGILPISAIIGEGVAQLYAIGAMLVMVTVLGAPPKPSWLMLVPLLAVQSLFNLGAAFIVSRATFHFRDVANFLPYVLRIWLYLSGIFFGLNLVPEGWMRTVFQLNPMYAFIHLARVALGTSAETEATSTLPGEFGLAANWGVAIGWSLLALLIGFFYFRARETEYGRG